MGMSKLEEFSSSQNRMALLAKAMAHPARIAILELLIERKSCLCNDIVAELPLAQATVSQHLKELKDSGILKASEEPPRVYYSIDEATCGQAIAVLGNLLRRMYQASIR